MDYSFLDDPEWKNVPENRKPDIAGIFVDEQLKDDPEWANVSDDRRPGIRDIFIQDAMSQHKLAQDEAYQAEIEKARNDTPGILGEFGRSIGRGVVSSVPEQIGKGLQWLDPEGGNQTVSDVGKTIEQFGVDNRKRFPGLTMSAEAENASNWNPRKWVAQGGESLVQSVAPMAVGLAAGAIGGPIAGVLGAGATAANVIGKTAGAVTGLGALGEMFYGGTAEDTYRENINRLPKEEAKQLAHITGGVEAGGELIQDLIPIPIFKGLGKAAQGSIIKTLTSREPVKKMLGGVLKTIAGEELTESGQQAAQTYAAQRYGVADQSIMDSVSEVWGPTLVTSLIFGAGGVGYNTAHRANIRKALTNPDVDSDTRLDAIHEVASAARDIDKETGDNFYSKAIDLWKQAKPITIDDDQFYNALSATAKNIGDIAAPGQEPAIDPNRPVQNIPLGDQPGLSIEQPQSPPAGPITNALRNAPTTRTAPMTASDREAAMTLDIQQKGLDQNLGTIWNNLDNEMSRKNIPVRTSPITDSEELKAINLKQQMQGKPPVIPYGSTQEPENMGIWVNTLKNAEDSLYQKGKEAADRSEIRRQQAMFNEPSEDQLMNEWARKANSATYNNVDIPSPPASKVEDEQFKQWELNARNNIYADIDKLNAERKAATEAEQKRINDEINRKKSLLEDLSKEINRRSEKIPEELKLIFGIMRDEVNAGGIESLKDLSEGGKMDATTGVGRASTHSEWFKKLNKDLKKEGGISKDLFNRILDKKESGKPLTIYQLKIWDKMLDSASEYNSIHPDAVAQADDVYFKKFGFEANYNQPINIESLEPGDSMMFDNEVFTYAGEKNGQHVLKDKNGNESYADPFESVNPLAIKRKYQGSLVDNSEKEAARMSRSSTESRGIRGLGQDIQNKIASLSIESHPDEIKSIAKDLGIPVFGKNISAGSLLSDIFNRAKQEGMVYDEDRKMMTANQESRGKRGIQKIGIDTQETLQPAAGSLVSNGIDTGDVIGMKDGTLRVKIKTANGGLKFEDFNQSWKEVGINGEKGKTETETLLNQDTPGGDDVSLTPGVDSESKQAETEKQPWEMTKAEYVELGIKQMIANGISEEDAREFGTKDIEERHRKEVYAQDSKHVLHNYDQIPWNVAKDYPDIAKRYGEKHPASQTQQPSEPDVIVPKSDSLYPPNGYVGVFDDYDMTSYYVKETIEENQRAKAIEDFKKKVASAFSFDTEYEILKKVANTVSAMDSKTGMPHWYMSNKEHKLARKIYYDIADYVRNGVTLEQAIENKRLIYQQPDEAHNAVLANKILDAFKPQTQQPSQSTTATQPNDAGDAQSTEGIQGQGVKTGNIIKTEYGDIKIISEDEAKRIDALEGIEEVKEKALKTIDGRINKLNEDIQDWSSRKYKSHGGTVLVGTDEEQGDTPWKPGVKRKDVDKINEKRRQNAIASLRENIQEEEKLKLSIENLNEDNDPNTIASYLHTALNGYSTYGNMDMDGFLAFKDNLVKNHKIKKDRGLTQAEYDSRYTDGKFDPLKVFGADDGYMDYLLGKNQPEVNTEILAQPGELGGIKFGNLPDESQLDRKRRANDLKKRTDERTKEISDNIQKLNEVDNLIDSSLDALKKNNAELAKSKFSVVSNTEAKPVLYKIDDIVVPTKDSGMKDKGPGKVQHTTYLNGIQDIQVDGYGGMHFHASDFEAYSQPNTEAKPTDSTYGKNNKIFTEERANIAREILRKKLGQLNAGIDPELLSAGLEIAGYHIEAGARSFADYSKRMIADLGDAVRPYLKSFYNAVRDYPGVENMDMTSHDEVSKYDVNAIGKEDVKENKVKPIAINELEPSFKSTLGLAADSPEQLRSIDVARVMSDAENKGYGKEFSKWLLSKNLQEKTKDKVEEYLSVFNSQIRPITDNTTIQNITPSQIIASWVSEKFYKGVNFTWQELFAKSDEAFRGTQTQGAYTSKDAYDAMELGVNQFILENKNGMYDPNKEENAASFAISGLKARIKTLLPTQTKRTAEQDEFQQFSTPPHQAYVAAWVANISPNDVVLEPSAGVGGLAVFAKNAGATVYVNELSQRRADLLDTLGFDKIYRENAEQINNILPNDIKPTVVLMNPPFSATAGRIQGQRKTINATRHIEQALDRLQPGGRLVAIVGEGMKEGAPVFRDWWGKIKDKYSVLANVGINGNEYAKYGTTFDNQILIIDKIEPNSDTKTITGQVDKVENLLPLLNEVRNVRQHETGRTGKQEGNKPDSKENADQGGRITGTGMDTQPSTVSLGREGATRFVEDTGAAGMGGNASISMDTAEGNGSTGGRTKPNRDDKGRTSRPDKISNSDTGTPGREIDGTGELVSSSTDELQIESAKKEANGELSENIYEGYSPEKINVVGAKKHPTPLVQSAAMASVSPPTPKYVPNIPQLSISKGKLSDIQLEAIVYAGESHGNILPSGERKGFFIGDGTGVGKGREIAGIFWDNWNKGRKKGIWISEKASLAKDAKRDASGVGWDAVNIFEHSKINAGSPIKLANGILFTTYDTLKSGTKNANDPKSRLDQIVKWVGKDFDGVIAFDESHNMGNSIAALGARGLTKPAAKALSGIELQKALPNARIVYVSATGATTVSNLAYCDRLGLWGEGTPFPNKKEFINQISMGGTATMEMVAQNMKASGVYTARSLSYDGVSYDRIEHELSPEQVQIYDKLAEGWQVILGNFNEAMKAVGITYETESGNSVTLNAQAKSAMLQQFWGSHQRFFNQIITSMQTPAIINKIHSDLKNGEAVVIQLVNTLEAAQDRAISKLTDEDSLDDLDLTPRDNMMMLVESSFPVTQYEQYMDENGNTRSRPVLDSIGNPVLNPEAVAMKERLLNELGSIKVPDSPIDMILNEFGVDNVAEITGRKRRVVKRITDKGEERVIEKRSKIAINGEADSFMNDGKKILIFSQAGGTGRSYHADLDSKNQRKRNHYLLQAGWKADAAVQGLGRSHRSNQKQPPAYFLVTTNLKGQKRFLSSIARRLDQLGALTKGQRETGSQGIFNARDNLESGYASDALTRFYRDLFNNNLDGITVDDFEQQTGLTITDVTGNALIQNLPPIKQFLNRLLSMKVETQNKVFEAFSDRLDDVIRYHAEQGTLDTGLETIDAKEIKKVGEQVVYTDKNTGAETKYVNLELTHDRRFLEYDNISKKDMVKNKRSGKVYSASFREETDAKTGAFKSYWKLVSPIFTSQNVDVSVLSDQDKWEKISDSNKKTEWETAIKAEPKTYTTNLHIVHGLLLPIWDRLSGWPRLVKTQTNEGERMIGRKIDDNQLSATLKRLGANNNTNKIEPSELKRKIVDEGQYAVLSNDWKIVRKTVSGESRIELVGPDYTHEQILNKYGVFSERIQFKTRYFIPDNEVGVNAIAKIIANNPVVDLINPNNAISDGISYSTAPIPETKVKPGNITVEKATQKLKPILDAVKKKGDVSIVIADKTSDIADSVIRGKVLKYEKDTNRSVRGFYYEKTIYIFTSQMSTMKETEMLLAHELIGHYGLYEFMGDDLGKFFDFARAKYGSDIDVTAKRRGIDVSTEIGREKAAKEWFAELVESGKIEPSLWSRFVVAVKNALRKMGFSVEFSDNDLSEIIRGAMKHAMGKGDTYRQRVGGAYALDYSTSSEVKAFREANNLPEIKMRNDGSHPTQIATTQSTYKKIFDNIMPDRIKSGAILDYGAGKNIGGKAIGADTFEPFPEKGFEPTYKLTQDIPSNSYDAIINNAVLNVVPDDIRDSIVKEIGRILKPNGMAFINARGKDVLNAKHHVIDASKMEVIIDGNKAYQKGFTQNELTSYLQETLGDNFKVENAVGKNSFGAVGSIITKTTNDSQTETQEFKLAADVVDGRSVLKDIPNTDSISASLDDYEILEGIREVPFSSFTQLEPLEYYSKQEQERTKNLAQKIKESGSISPLIVVVDNEGPYILEGGHRFDALRELNAKSFPALVVMDQSDTIDYSDVTPFTGTIPTAVAKIKTWLNEHGYKEKAEKLATLWTDQDISISERQKELGDLPESQDYNMLKRLIGKRTAEELKLFNKNRVKPLIKEMADAKLKYEDVDELLHADHAPERNLQMKRINARRYIDSVVGNMTGKEAEPYQSMIDEIGDELDVAGLLDNDISVLNEKRDAYVEMMDDLANETLSTIDIKQQEIADLQSELDSRDFTEEEIEKGTPERKQKEIDNKQKRLDQRIQISTQWEDVKDRLSGMTNEKSTEIKNKWKGNAAIKSVSDQFRKINSDAFDMMHEAGELTDEEYESMGAPYEKHVPLMREGFPEGKAATGMSGYGPLGKPIKIAAGSTRKVIDITANIINRYEAEVNRKYKLEASRAMYEMVSNNPDSDRWNIEEPKKVPRLDDEGNLRYYDERKTWVEKNEVLIKVDGKLIKISVPDDNPSMMRWMDAVKREPVDLNPVLKASQKITRVLAALNTSFSLEFLMTNFMRDLPTALIHLETIGGTEGAQKAVVKNIKAAIKGIYQAERGDDSSEFGKIYRDFAKHGGKVGWMQGYDSVSELAKNLEKELAYEEGKYPNREKLRKLGDWIEAMNTSVENGVRLSAYKVMIDGGMSKLKAADAASGLTVDFTQHGTIGPGMNALYMFMNAGIQGNVRMFQALKNPKVLKISGGIVALGAAANLFGAIAGGDDDDGEAYYDKLKKTNPELFERNMVFMIPGSKGKYFKIPMPYGYNAFFVLGNEAAGTIRGISPIDGMARVGSAVMGTINPLSSATLMQTFAPTLLDPFVQAGENKSWFGGDLMPKQNPFGPPVPDSERYFKSVNPLAKGVAQWVNSVTGGDKYKSGMIDMSPETIEMIFEVFSGSAGRLVKDALFLPGAVATGDIEMNKVPFARKLIGDTPERINESIYRENSDAVDIFIKRFKEADAIDRQSLRTNPMMSMIAFHKQTDSELLRLNKILKLSEKRNDIESTKNIKDRILIVKNRYNKKFNQMNIYK